MKDFIVCLIDKQYDKVGGLEVWEELYMEYLSLRENKSSQYVLSMLREIIHLKSKAYIITTCVNVLSVRYNPLLIDELKQTGVRGKFDVTNELQYNQDLKGALTFCKRYVLQFEAKEKELNDFEKNHIDNKGSRKDFDLWVVTLSRYMHYKIELEKTTATEWAYMLNDYERFCEVENSKNKPIWEKQG